MLLATYFIKWKNSKKVHRYQKCQRFLLAHWNTVDAQGLAYYAYFLTITLCYNAHKIYLLCSKLWSRIRIVLSLLSDSLFIYKMQFRKTNLLKMALYVLLDNDCLIRVYQSFVVIFKIFPIVLALCLMLSVTSKLCWHNQLVLINLCHRYYSKQYQELIILPVYICTYNYMYINTVDWKNLGDNKSSTHFNFVKAESS